MRRDAGPLIEKPTGRSSARWVPAGPALCFLGLLGLLLSLFGAAGAASMHQSRPVRVGVYQNEPKIFTGGDGKAAGIFIELIEAMAGDAGWELTYVPCEWSTCLSLLQRGEIDLLPDVAYTAARDEVFDFHKTPALQSWSRVYRSPGVPIADFADLDGRRVAVVRGSVQQESLRQLTSGFGYQVALIEADSFEAAFRLAEDGAADAAVANHFFGEHFYRRFGLETTSIEFNPSSLYFAAPAGRNADLLSAIDGYLDEWVSAPDSPYQAILDDWLPPPPSTRVPELVYWLIGGIAALLLGMTAVALLLRREVRRRTSHLQTANAGLRDSQERLGQQSRELQALNAVGNQVTGSLTLDDVISTAMGEIMQVVQPDAAMMLLRDGDRLIERAYAPAEERENVDPFPQHRVGACLCGLAVNDGKPVYSLDIFSDDRCTWDECKRAGFRSSASLPLRSGDESLGVLGLFTREPRDFESQATFLETLAAQVSTAIRNALLHERVLHHASELEQRVAERTAELEIAREKAESADRLKSIFLATMSHELRTPLNSIIGFTGILRQELPGPLNAEQAKQLDMVRGSARHLLALINDVLDISKIEAGELDVSHDAFDVRSSVEEVMRLVTPEASRKGLSLSAAIGPDVGTIVSDQRRFEQILLNLVGNAVKFTERGEVAIECQSRGGAIITSVRDTGPGIRPADIPRLFQPFQQIESGLDRRHEGTGLGLSICRSLAGLLGGEVGVVSQWGSGSTFSFTVPATGKGGAGGQHPRH